HRQRDHRPQGARADGAVLRVYHLMGGPEMAPQTPQRSGRPGEAVAPLDATGGLGGPEIPPPNARGAPAKPWRSSMLRAAPRGRTTIMTACRVALVFAALLLLPALAGAAPEGKIVIAQGVDPTTLDPQWHEETPAYNVLLNIYD